MADDINNIDLHSLSSLDSNFSSGENPRHLHNENELSAENSNLNPIPSRGSKNLNNSQTNVSTKTNRVPSSEKRGLLCKWALLPEYEDPRNYPQSTKNIIVFIVAFAAICGPMGSSIILPAINDVVDDLHTQVILVNVSVGVYLLSLGILPIWWSAFSERFGRRSIYIISFTLFVGFSIGASLSPNISALIIFRMLCGGCSASVQAVGAGTIADLYPQNQRGRAMGVYYLGPLMGPFLAPIIGGAVAQAWGWRATQWVLVIASGIADMFIIFGLPETLRKQDNMANIRQLFENLKHQNAESTEDEKESDEQRDISPIHPDDKLLELERLPSLEQIQTAMSQISRRSNNITEEDQEDEVLDDLNLSRGVGDSLAPSLSKFTSNKSNYSRRVQLESLHHELTKSLSRPGEDEKNKTKFQKFKSNSYEFIIRPLHSLVLLGYPPVALVISHSAICFAGIYLFNISITYEYSRPPYNFSSVLVGLCYIPNSTTYVLASILGGRWIDILSQKYADAHNGEMRPEARISWNLVVATILYPPACLIYGWTIQYGIMWVVPLIGTALFGFSSMLVIGATVTYLVDTLPGKGATGVALNNFVRQMLAATATFIVEPLLKALKPGILFSITTAIILISSLSLVYLKVKGDKLRNKYDISAYYEKL